MKVIFKKKKFERCDLILTLFLKMVDKAKVVFWLEFIIPIVIAIPFLFKIIVLDPERPLASPCMGILLWTALYWVFEPIPIVISSFFPVFLMPLFHISTAKMMATSMWSDTTMVFFGGFMYSFAMIRWNLHTRLSLKTVLLFGVRPWLLLLGLMLVTTILAMWVSNTATALTMLPNALAIITKLEEITGDPVLIEPFAKCLFLAIPFCCSVGGMVTLIGTPPNLILAQIARERFPKAEEIGFTTFLFVSLPICFIVLAIMYFYFLIVFIRKVKLPDEVDIEVFHQNYQKLGKMKAAEWLVAFLFVFHVFLWLFRSNIQSLIGWSNRLYSDGSSFISDGTVAILFGILLFIIRVPEPTVKEEKQMMAAEVEVEIKPKIAWRHREEISLANTEDELDDDEEDPELIEEVSTSDGMTSNTNVIDDNNNNEESTMEPVKKKKFKKWSQKDINWVPLLDWEYTQAKVPWNIIFLFSGGFCLNQGMMDSGMDVWLGNILKGFSKLPLFPLLLIMCVITGVLSSVASNTCCANILLPIMAVFASNSEKYHPWMLMFPICYMTSFCFLLPVSTPPNLISYGYGKLKLTDFVIHGSFFTIISMLINIALCMALLPKVFDAGHFPDWAKNSN